MTLKTPDVPVLAAITPSPASARMEKFQYTKLETAATNEAKRESDRQKEFWASEDGSIAEQESATKLAKQYMLMGSLALTRTRNKELWSQRFTTASSEIYGMPEPETARKLWNEAQNGELENYEAPFKNAAEQMHGLLEETYSTVYDALDLEDDGLINSDGIAEKFEAALKVLSSEYDDDWSKWSIVRNHEKDSLSVSAENKKVVVGMRRANVTPVQLKSLFTHEVLVHGLRAVNGNKKSQKLAEGLPGYLDAEEGLGVFMEYAVSGRISEKNIDRYTDIAYALGQIDGQSHTRQELIELAMLRAIKRNDSVSDKKSQEDIEKEVYAHVNRIYRGSLGDENVGVFTKDISYYRGFMEIGAYIESDLEKGRDIAEVHSFLVSGKFDPTNPAHLQYLQEL